MCVGEKERERERERERAIASEREPENDVRDGYTDRYVVE
jgi:hypothetical protein